MWLSDWLNALDYVLIHSLICRSTAVVMSAAFKYGRKYCWNFCAVRNLTLSGLNSRTQVWVHWYETGHSESSRGVNVVCVHQVCMVHIFEELLVVCIMFYWQWLERMPTNGLYILISQETKSWQFIQNLAGIPRGDHAASRWGRRGHSAVFLLRRESASRGSLELFSRWRVLSLICCN
jgi:hypothetical protein